MKKVEKLYVYSNNKLYLMLINRYEKIPLIVYEREIDRFRIRDIRKSSYLEGVRAKILQVEEEVNRNFSEILKNSLPKLLLTTESIEVRREQFTKIFDERCEVNKEDIKRIINKGLNDIQGSIDENKQVTEYKILNYVFDDSLVNSIHGRKVEEIKLIVDLIVTDNATVNEVQSVFKNLGIVFESKYLIDYRLLRRLKRDNTVIIDLNYEINKVFLKENKALHINYLNTGLGTILNRIYEHFKNEYDEKKAEEITRFVKKNWILNKFHDEHAKIEDIEVKKIVKTTEEICLQYFRVLFEKLNRFEKFYIICDEISERELIRFLNLNFDQEIKPAFPNDLIISSTIDNKIGYCINEIYDEEA